MKRWLTIAACMLGFAGFGQDVAPLIAAEYFINHDPGVGNGTPLSIGSTGDVISFSSAIPAGSLATGFYYIGARAKDADGNWGLAETRGFYITSSSADASSITAAEYFIDADPGAGNGTAINIGAIGDVVSFSVAIPIASFSAGFHHVYIRTRDAAGSWGLFESRGFYISAGTTNVTSITAAEYFIDTDPGVGNGTAITIAAPGDSINLAIDIPISLDAGFHTVYIRTKDAAGIWGLYDSRGFYVSPLAVDAPPIVAAEFFYNTDPGTGSGSPVVITAPVDLYKDSLVLPLGSLPIGNHTVGVRVKDADGAWSIIEEKKFKVCQVDGPLSHTRYLIENNQVFFTNTSTNNDTTRWEFGDGTFDTVLNPIKTYAAAANICQWLMKI